MNRSTKFFVCFLVFLALAGTASVIDLVFGDPKPVVKGYVPTTTTTPPPAVAHAAPTPTPTPPRPLTPAEQRAEAQRELAEKKRQREELKTQIESSYEALITSLYSYYNYIKVVRRGNALWAEHSYFSQYTFQIGSDGPAVQRWVGA